MINRRLWYLLKRLFKWAHILSNVSRDCGVVVKKYFPNNEIWGLTEGKFCDSEIFGLLKDTADGKND